MSYNVVKKVEDYQQIICNIISYVLWLYEKRYIDERTKNELLKRCNPDEYAYMKGGDNHGKR